MAYSEELANRVRTALAVQQDAVEKKMMGGLCFMLRGHMCCGVLGNDLVVRVGPEQHQHALRQPHARPMDFTGRPITGFVFVGPAGLRADRDLRTWLQRATNFLQSLPRKKKADRGTRRRSMR